MLYVTSLAASFVLFFVAVGLLLGNQAGNVLVPYAALFTAIALSSSTLIISVVKKRKNVLHQTERKPFIPSAPLPIEKPVIVASPARKEQVVQKVANSYLEHKIKSTELFSAEPFHYRKTLESSTTKPKSEVSERIEEPFNAIEKTSAKKEMSSPITDEKTMPDQETVKGKNGLLTCPKCKKEFSQPIFMVSYSDSKQPKLVAHCPYCDQKLEIVQKTSEEELLKKYF